MNFYYITKKDKVSTQIISIYNPGFLDLKIFLGPPGFDINLSISLYLSVSLSVLSGF